MFISYQNEGKLELGEFSGMIGMQNKYVVRDLFGDLFSNSNLNYNISTFVCRDYLVSRPRSPTIVCESSGSVDRYYFETSCSK